MLVLFAGWLNKRPATTTYNSCLPSHKGNCTVRRSSDCNTNKMQSRKRRDEEMQPEQDGLIFNPTACYVLSLHMEHACQ